MRRVQLLTGVWAMLGVTSIALADTSTVNQQRIVKAAHADAGTREAGNWLSHGRTYSEQRFSPLKRINAGNVQQLGLAWQHKLDIDRAVEATPIVVDGVMYATGAGSIVYALNAVTGQSLWTYDPKVSGIDMAKGCCDIANRGVAVWKGKVFVGAYDGRLIALNASTGKPLWSTDTITDHSMNYTVTGAPRVVQGKVIIGNGGAEKGVRGYVAAYDADTGKLAWRFYTVPGDPTKPAESKALEAAQKTWFGNEYWKQGGGGTVWDAMAYDPDLDLLYIGTGNGSSWNRQFRSEGKGDNLYLSSIVALRPATGEYVWHYQTTPGDSWDFTATQHMILAELPINGQIRQVIMQAPKNGFFYVLDRKTGELLSAEKFAPANWASHVDKATGRPAIDWNAVDYNGTPKLVYPSPLGAHNWQPMSYNPQTGLVYIPMQESAAMLGAPATLPVKGTHPAAWNLGASLLPPPEDPKVVKDITATIKGKLLAWDPVLQKARWTQDYANIWNGGTLSTAGNLVFQGTADGRVVAYMADTGKPVWESKVNSGVMAGPITYEVKGRQYVTFMSGWGGAYPLVLGAFANNAKVKPEARILTYALGGKATLPPARNEPQALPQLPPAPGDAAVVARGQSLFNDTCGFCHGVNAVSGGVIPDLRYMKPATREQFNDIVLNGLRAARGMPPFAGVMSAEDVSAIHAYLIKRSYDLKAELANP